MRAATHRQIVSDLERRHAEERRAWEAERERLLDRLIHLSGHPAMPSPIAEEEELYQPDEIVEGAETLDFEAEYAGR